MASRIILTCFVIGSILYAMPLNSQDQSGGATAEQKALSRALAHLDPSEKIELLRIIANIERLNTAIAEIERQPTAGIPSPGVQRVVRTLKRERRHLRKRLQKLLIAKEAVFSVKNNEGEVLFLSNFIFRGRDVYANNFVRKNKAYASFNSAPALQVTWDFSYVEWHPFELRIRGILPLQGRNDSDSDKRFQATPGGDGFVSLGLARDYLNNTLGTLDATRAAISALQNAITLSDAETTIMHNEPNGLAREDVYEIHADWTLKTKDSELSYGIIGYAYPNALDAELGAVNLEPYFKLGWDFLTWIHGDKKETRIRILDFETYYNIAVLPTYRLYSKLKLFDLEWKDKTIKNNDGTDLGVNTELSIGYGIHEHVRGIQDVTWTVTGYWKKIRVGVVLAYRPQPAFVDPDARDRFDDFWLITDGTAFDGKIDDPSRNNGLNNNVINNIANSLFTPSNPSFRFAPKQKIPRLIWAFNVGYDSSW